jgi:small subunit ribosomal protein S20
LQLEILKHIIMANHKSSKKRIKQDIVIRLRNRYYKKSARTAIAKLREMGDASEAATYMPKVFSMVDKLAKKNTWHKNKAANLKSSLAKHVNSLSK